MTDSNQAVVWQVDSKPFGETETLVDSISGFPAGFPGQYSDSGTGYVYNYFRDYDPSIGRYIQSDPIGLGGGLNTYGYVYQNPRLYINAFGLSALCLSNASMCQAPTNVFDQMKDSMGEKVWDKVSGDICKDAETCNDVKDNLVDRLKGTPAIFQFSPLWAPLNEICIMQGIEALCSNPWEDPECLSE